jgi:two-component system, OmpR family, sensor histidine kinase QseC
LRNRLKKKLKPASLRTYLLIMLLSVTSLVWLAASVWSYSDARHEAEELLDAQLAQSARLLMAQTRHELVDEGAEHLAAFDFMYEHGLHPYEQNLQFRIEDGQGRTLLSSANPPPVLTEHSSGYADVFVDGQGWRVLVINDKASSLRVEVAQSLAIRDELAQHVALRLAIPVLLALPLLGVLIYLVVGRALRPLNALANTVKTRTPANLVPVESRGLPREVQPLADALNRLLDRLSRALESERRFTADASHELRTPLAAIQMQAQVALATASDADRRHALEQVLAGTRRATGLVEQLLRLARIDPLAGLAQTQAIELDALAAQVVAELCPDAGTCRLRLAPTNDIGVTIEGDADLLGVALRNLVGNALRHAPAASEITVGVEQGNGEPQLWVADNGPGVPEAELPHLTERFYRGRDATTEGSGLGLAIVKRIAELHGANLELENRLQGGLRAALVWRI